MARCSKARRFSEDLARHWGVLEKERVKVEEKEEMVVVVGSLGAMAPVMCGRARCWRGIKQPAKV